MREQAGKPRHYKVVGRCGGVPVTGVPGVPGTAGDPGLPGVPGAGVAPGVAPGSVPEVPPGSVLVVGATTRFGAVGLVVVVVAAAHTGRVIVFVSSVTAPVSARRRP